MRQPFWLRVTGSCSWDDVPAIEQAPAVILARYPEAACWCTARVPAEPTRSPPPTPPRTPGYRIEAHPADWRRHGRAAGYRRNAEIIALGADGCAEFVRGGSPGSTSAVRLAWAAGISGPDRFRQLP